MIIRLIVSVLFGIIGILYVAPYDPWIAVYAGNKLKNIFEQSFECAVSYHSCSVSFFPLNIVLTDFHVIPRAGLRWSWRADTFAMGCSWHHLFATGIADLHIKLEGLSVQTEAQGTDCAIIPHARKLFGQAALGFPTVLKEVLCGHSICHVREADSSLKVCTHFSGLLKRLNNKPNGILTIERAVVKKSDQSMLAEGAGVVRLLVDTHNQKDPLIKLTGEVRVPHASSRYFLSGSWCNGNGCGAIHDVTGELTIDPISFDMHTGQPIIKAFLQGTCPALLQLAGVPKSRVQDITGTGIIDIIADRQSVQFNAQINNIAYRGYEACSAMTATGHRSNEQWNGSLSVFHKKDEKIAQGTWQIFEKDFCAKVHCVNTAELNLGRFCESLTPQAVELCCQVDKSGLVSGTCNIKDEQQKEKYTGIFKVDSCSVQVEGTCQANKYQLLLGLQPEWYLDYFVYQTAANKPIIELQRTKQWHHRLSGFFELESLCTGVQVLTGHVLDGHGRVDVKGYTKPGQVVLQLGYKQGLISISGLYNCIQSFQTRVCCDFNQKQLMWGPSVCNLNRGQISCDRAVVGFQGLNRLFVHIPLTLRECWINIDQSLFLALSGQLLLSKQPYNSPLFSGSLILDHVQLTENIFSGVFEKGVLQSTRRLFTNPVSDMQCSIAVLSKNPIRVNTPFLSTTARLNAHVHNRVQDPRITGTLELLDGQINFPYKPLFITKGSLSFCPDALKDPRIELSATNTIKGHDVALHVQGSRTNHEMNLNADPHLSQEQIISLLFTGSPYEPLSALIPAFLIHNIASLVFNSVDTDVPLNRYLKTLFKPMQRVHLIPNFVDQAGRGGLRGTIEIDINDQWRALLQKNFSLAEDARCEIEYRLSDDMSVRAFKDEQRNIGGEFEMRWKW